MDYQGKLNRYLHPPVQFLMFDSDEVKIIAGLLIVAQVVGGIFWALPIAIPYWLFPYKREQNRGFFNHELYHLGLVPLLGYPSTEAKSILRVGHRLKIFNKGRESASNKKQVEELNDTQAILKAVNLNKVLIIGVLGLCAAMYNDITAIKEDHKTILMWPNGTTSWVTGADVDTTYARMMTGYLITMWGNISSSTVGAQFGEILKFSHPFYHAELRKKLQKRAEQIKKYKTVTISMSSVLGEGSDIKKERLETHKFSKITTPVYKVSYKTRSNLLFNNKKDPTSNEKTLIFYFTVDNGSSWLLDIEESIHE